jgi:hypothetical protein
MRWLAPLVGIALAASAGTALACSCVRYASARAQLEEADVMFVGVAEASSPPTPGAVPLVSTRFRVTRTLKGATGPLETVQHWKANGGNCGVDFAPGRTYVIIAHRDDGQLGTSGCSRPQFPLEDYERAVHLAR